MPSNHAFMRRAGRELWEILGIWWLLIPGGIVAAVATVQLVEDIHHKSLWFWATWVMTGFAIAGLIRSLRVSKERDAARAALAKENTQDAVIRRLDGLREEYEQLGAEAPGELEGPGPIPTEEQEAWGRSTEHLGERIASELRRNAPGYVAYWRSNTEQMPPIHPFVPFAKAWTGMAIGQLRHITDRLRAGHDEP